MSEQSNRLTQVQAAIVGAYTGFAIGPFSDIHAYAERVLRRPIMTHEFASKALTAELREAAKADFVALAYVEAPPATPA
jgi:hypothetical protein